MPKTRISCLPYFCLIFAYFLLSHILCCLFVTLFQCWVYGFLGITKIQKMSCPKYQDFTPIQYYDKQLILLNNIFDLMGFTNVLRYSDFQNWSRSHHRKILWKHSEKPIVLDSKVWFAKKQDSTSIQNYEN